MLELAQRTLTAICPQSESRATSTSVAFSLPGQPGWTGHWLAEPADWEPVTDQLRASGNPFLDPRLLAYLSKHPPGVATGLLWLRHVDGAQLIATIQFLTFRADEQIQLDAYSKRGWRKRWARWLRFEALSVGQLLTTGPFGVMATGEDPAVFAPDLLPQAGEALARYLRRRGRSVHAVLLKDLTGTESPRAATWRALGYHPLPVQPNMELRIPADWRQPADYRAALTSKYRVRYRRARKKAQDIRCRELTGEELTHRRAEMHALYRAIATDAGFNAVALPVGYFRELQQRLGDRFRVFGYFRGERLVGFRTELASDRRLFAHYIGFDPAVNRETQLYQNMLYDLLESAIEGGFATLDYGRTALEIKSSVGAEAVSYFCGLKSLVPGLNWLIEPIANYLSPVPEWQPRSPFRT
jgi:hypothetical protein